jgi:hypothetical protein
MKVKSQGKNGWVKGGLHPTHVAIGDGEPVDLKRGKPDARGFIPLSKVLKAGDLAVITHVRLGNRPHDPSYSWTIECKASGEIAACSICGNLYIVNAFNLAGDAPTCSKCRKARKVVGHE